MNVPEYQEYARSLLQRAAREWIDLYADDEPDDSESHPSNNSGFMWLARSIYHESLRERDLKSKELNKPISAVCNDFPDDGLPILYMHMGRGGEVLYIGKSMHVKQRQQMHRQSSYWWNKVSYIEFDLFSDEESLGVAEVLAIEKYRPKYNKNHNGGRMNA